MVDVIPALIVLALVSFTASMGSPRLGDVGLAALFAVAAVLAERGNLAVAVAIAGLLALHALRVHRVRR